MKSCVLFFAAGLCAALALLPLCAELTVSFQWPVIVTVEHPACAPEPVPVPDVADPELYPVPPPVDVPGGVAPYPCPDKG